MTIKNSNLAVDLEEKAKKLLEETKELGKKMDESAEEREIFLDGISQEVDSSVKEIDEICTDLDAADEEANEEFGKILTDMAEDVANNKDNSIAE